MIIKQSPDTLGFLNYITTTNRLPVIIQTGLGLVAVSRRFVELHRLQVEAIVYHFWQKETDRRSAWLGWIDTFDLDNFVHFLLIVNNITSFSLHLDNSSIIYSLV